MQIKFYKDNYGFRRAECPPAFEVVGSYLEEEIQGSIQNGWRLIELINDIQTDRQASWEGTGNAHTVTLTPNFARIVNEFSDDVAPCEISLENFKKVIIEWLNFIQTSD
jgi:uncharacterized protein YacL (UPF0231 family)